MGKKKRFLDMLRPDRLDSKRDAAAERITAIGHSSDAVGWRPVPYTTPERFEQFLSDLDPDIESFITKANPDRDNPHFYEKTVDKEVALALKELESQRTEHKRYIHNIRIYQQASLTYMQNHLRSMEEALARKREEIQ